MPISYGLNPSSYCLHRIEGVSRVTMVNFPPQARSHGDDSVALFSTSTTDSPLDSASPSSTSPYHSPTHPSSSLQSTSYKLTVRNLSYKPHPKRKPLSFCWSSLNNKEPPILNSVSFDAKSSEILAIVGPSGAGKSTLLRVISGRISSSEFEPRSIMLNHHPVTKPSQLRKMCGFVTQEDNLLPFLTVKETLMFSAYFRLRQRSAKEKEERVALLMRELNLAHIANSYIGDAETRGVSGGEKKRVSIGVDMIHDPPILLLDEPTSGLDSASALQVVELLSSMANSKQRTIILTIHQPSYRILQYVSSFLLLSRGLVVHCGSLDSLETTIARSGFRIPDQINSLEYAMEIIKSLESSAMAEHICPSKQDHDSTTYTIWPGYKVQPQEQEEDTGEQMGVKFWRLYEIMCLVARFWKTIYRTKQLLLARTMQAIVGGLGLGSVYLRVKKDDEGIAERLGLFAFSLSFLLSSTVEALPIFLQERQVLMREASRGAYKVSSYVIANTLVFIPFMLAVSLLFAFPVYWLVGLNPTIAAFSIFVMVVWLIVLMASSLVIFLSAVSPDFIAGNSLICLVLGAFFLFSGYFIPKDSIPRYWTFMYYVSLYKYPLDCLLINEYWSLREDCFSRQEGDARSCVRTGRDVLKGRGLDESSIWLNLGIMLGFFIFYRVLCWIVLARKAATTML